MMLNTVMRVNEVITESVIDEYAETDRGIIDALRKKGYKYLGSGVDQTAFKEPSTGLVLKIFGTDETDQFSDDHKMFFKWYKFCTKNQANPFLPRFYGHESFFWEIPSASKEKHRYLMIRTEPLHDAGLLGDVLSNAARNVVDGDSVKTVLRYLEETNPLSYSNLVSKISKAGLIQFLNTCKKLEQMGDRSGFSWDLHGGNIMMRADGTPIINDPWVN
jgi:hypothetical protein